MTHGDVFQKVLIRKCGKDGIHMRVSEKVLLAGIEFG